MVGHTRRFESKLLLEEPRQIKVNWASTSPQSRCSYSVRTSLQQLHSTQGRIVRERQLFSSSWWPSTTLDAQRSQYFVSHGLMELERPILNIWWRWWCIKETDLQDKKIAVINFIKEKVSGSRCFSDQDSVLYSLLSRSWASDVTLEWGTWGYNHPKHSVPWRRGQ